MKSVIVFLICCLEETFRVPVRLYLIAFDRVVSHCSLAAEGQLVEHSATERHYIKAELDLLLGFDTCEIETLIVDDLLDDTPIKPGETQLNIKA